MRGSLLGLAVLAMLSHPGMARSESWRLTVSSSGSGSKVERPLIVPVPNELPTGSYRASLPGASRPLDVQVFDDDGTRLAGMVVPSGEVAGTAVLEPLDEEAAGAIKGVSLTPRESNIEITIGGKPFTAYRTDSGPKPILYPLIGPGGQRLTRDYPMKTVEGEDKDHPHHRSLWFTFGKVNGEDFWTELKDHGSIQETAKRSVISGPALGRLRTTDRWVSSQGKHLLDDERVVTIYRTETARILDFEITLRALDVPVTFADTKEGMFAVRVASSMDADQPGGGTLVNAEGLGGEQAWGKASPWVDYFGPVDGKQVGIAILNHPRSFRYPTTWHVRTYGLFAANPFGWHDFGLGKSGEHILPAGQTLWFGYRLILHDGDTAAGQIAQGFDAYANPPVVEIKAD